MPLGHFVGISRSANSLYRNILLSGACLLALLTAGVAPARAQASAPSPQDIEQSLQRAISLIRVQPHVKAQYDYVMAARVRLLLFWVGQEDVGGGYIRQGEVSSGDDPAEFLQVVMGSDPAKTPMAINRWGAAWELLPDPASKDASPQVNTFMGFMKVSKGTSVTEMQKELSQEKQGGGFLFSTILNQAGPNANFAKEVPFQSDRDFTIYQLDQAEPFVFDRLATSQGKLKSVDAKQVQECGRPEGFLSSVAELVGDALQGQHTPSSLCYFYNGERYSMTLAKVTPVPQETVHISLHQQPQPYVHTYRDLLRMHVDILDETTGERSNFELLVGTNGELRGVPVRISYEPNWWFQVILNLKAPEPSERATVANISATSPSR